MKYFRLPQDVGSDYVNPTIFMIKDIKVFSDNYIERTFTDCCCENKCSCDGNCSCDDFCGSHDLPVPGCGCFIN